MPFIERAFRQHVGTGTFRVADVFCGTASVSRLFKRLGNKVTANDNLMLGYVFAQAALNVGNDPDFAELFEAGKISEPRFGRLCATPYDGVLAFLNEVPGEDGFFYQEYSPHGTRSASHERRYFSNDNARKIDAIRRKIRAWKQANLLSEANNCLLLADLMRAANRVANIAGTYGCFNKQWDARAGRPLQLQRSPIVHSPHAHKVFRVDANQLAREYEFDVLYLDPPYTWRHYGAYYHILETLAWGDHPTVSGRTGLRPWLDSRSRYCHRTDAASALDELVRGARSKHLFLSYNSEGLIAHDQIMDILKQRGSPICLEADYRRYRSNSGGTKEKRLKECLYYVRT